MKVIVCLDNQNGMLFNGRRLSRDRLLTADILRRLDGKLHVSPFSASLFPDAVTSETFLDEAQSGDWCFVEDRALTPYEARIELLVVYRWNREYPSDMQLDLPLTNWQLRGSEEFAGYSHETLTREVYIK